jgi:PAS domain S-box-containing protein
MATRLAAQSLDPATTVDLLQTLLDVSLTGFILFRPLYAELGGPIQDLAYEYLSPAAQQMLRLPECPTETFLTLYPAAQETGIFSFYAAAFHSGQTERYQHNYQADGLDGFFHLVARRSGERLVVSFTDTNDQPRSAVEEALRQSQAREQAARAEAEAERRQLREVLSQLPAQVATYRGPDYVYEFINERYHSYFPQQAFLGRPIHQAIPEAATNGVLALFEQVYRTGEPFHNAEQELWLTTHANDQPQQLFLSFTLLPLRDAQGHVTGLLDFSYEVTAQVQARQQVQHLNQDLAATNEELAALNEELTATNEEYLWANAALGEAQQQLQQLNAELEARVQQRTQELQVSTQVAATARQASEASASRLRLITDALPVLIGYLDPEQKYRFVNQAYQAWFLQEPDALLGRPVWEIAGEMAYPRIQGYLERALAGERVDFEVEMPFRPDFTKHLRTTYIPDVQDGRVVGCFTLVSDMTEQVLARAQREAQQAELQRLFAQAPMAIVVLRGPTFIIEQANENAELIWGRTAAEVLGRPHFEAIPDSAGQGFEALLTGVLESGEPVVLHEVPIELDRPHTGRPNTGYYTIIFKPLRDEHQRVTRIAVMWTESTDQVLARQQVQDLNEELAAINEELIATNEELHQSNTRLTRTNTDLGTFVYTASHDLKAPISNIESLVVALRDTLPAAVQQDELVGQLLDLLDNTVHRFLDTISQLTDLSRLQRAYEEPTELLALRPIVDGVLADLAPAIAEAGADVQVQVPAALTISFTPAGLRSIVFNLLSNAVKYRDPARPVRVQLRAARQPQGVVLTVTDNGLGLTESQQQRLFQVFQRLHTHVAGSGVGLYMIKRLLENAAASIVVTSTVAVGTTFTVTFPV